MDTERALKTLLTPIVKAAVAEVMKQREIEKERIGYPEREAARLLGVRSHVLRDARRRGEISGRRVGRSVTYSRAALVRWLEAVE